MTFIFIVFRPYHIISSYNIIQVIKKEHPDAKCIGYITNATGEFWDDLFDYDKIFDEKYYSLNLFLEKNIFNIGNVLHNNFKIKSCINSLYLNNPKVDGIITYSDTWKIFQKVALKYQNVTNNCIVMDEGTALYCKNDVVESSLLKKIYRKCVYGWDFESCSMGDHTRTTKIYANFPEKVKAKSKKVYLMPKLNYSNILDIIKIKAEIINSNRKKCLYISSPTFFLNNEDKANSIKCTIKLFEILSNDNIEIYFKMHPANETIEDIRIYLEKFKNIKVIEDQSIPVELLCFTNKFDYIISPLSSALLNLASFKFNCISLPYFAERFLNYVDILELFIANGIKVALNEEELISIMKMDEINTLDNTIIDNSMVDNTMADITAIDKKIDNFEDNSKFLNSLIK